MTANQESSLSITNMTTDTLITTVTISENKTNYQYGYIFPCTSEL